MCVCELRLLRTSRKFGRKIIDSFNPMGRRGTQEGVNTKIWKVSNEGLSFFNFLEGVCRTSCRQLVRLRCEGLGTGSVVLRQVNMN